MNNRGTRMFHMTLMAPNQLWDLKDIISWHKHLKWEHQQSAQHIHIKDCPQFVYNLRLITCYLRILNNACKSLEICERSESEILEF